MKHFFKVCGFYLGYFFYFLITVDERINYLQAVQRGYDCFHSKDDSYLVYGSARMYYFDKTKLPTRHYSTFKEYRKIYYPII